jgi:hypothetical protein
MSAATRVRRIRGGRGAGRRRMRGRGRRGRCGGFHRRGFSGGRRRDIRGIPNSSHGYGDEISRCSVDFIPMGAHGYGGGGVRRIDYAVVLTGGGADQGSRGGEPLAGRRPSRGCAWR